MDGILWHHLTRACGSSWCQSGTGCCWKSLYSCHLAWVDGIVWHHLAHGCGASRCQLGTGSLLVEVSLTVVLFLPFSLSRRSRSASPDVQERRQQLRDWRQWAVLPSASPVWWIWARIWGRLISHTTHVSGAVLIAKQLPVHCFACNYLPFHAMVKETALLRCLPVRLTHREGWPGAQLCATPLSWIK